MAEIGKSKGADPTEWYATFSPMSINNLDIEVFEGCLLYTSPSPRDSTRSRMPASA